MSKFTYVPMPGGILNKTQAVIVGKELQKISKAKGAITPENMVDEARPEKSPLHSFFTWDDSEAAELFRQQEARRVIRSVRIIRVDMPAAEQSVVRAFLNVVASDTETEFEGQAYIPMARVQKSPVYEQQVLTRAKDELRAWTERYQDYKQYFGVLVKEVIGEMETA